MHACMLGGEAGWCLLDAKVLGWPTGVVAGREDEATNGHAALAVADHGGHCRRRQQTWRGCTSSKYARSTHTGMTVSTLVLHASGYHRGSAGTHRSGRPTPARRRKRLRF